MAYRIGNLPADAPDWIVRELRAIQEASTAVVDGVTYNKLYAQPRKLYEGLTVLADGTTWDPGSGAGTYQYRDGAWRAWEGAGGGGGGGLTAEDVDDRVASLLVAGSNIALAYNDAGNTLTVSAVGIPQTLRVSVDFGAGWSDKAQTVVTGQSWVTANSELTAQILTPTGTDPDEMYLLGMRVEISSLVPGTGFTVTVYSEAEASGTYTVMVMGN